MVENSSKLKKLITRIINEEFNRADYLKWKRKNVTYRGMQNVGQENGGSSVLGNGLYSAALSNKSMAKGYGELYFAVNAVPKNPKIFNTLNEWEIWFQNKLVFPHSQSKGKTFPDKRDFFASTTIEDEMMKLGYDGIIIKGREMVNYKPENVKYYKTEQGVIDHYNHYIAPEGLNEIQTQPITKEFYHGTRTPLPFERFDPKLDGSGLVNIGRRKFGGFFFTDSKENAEYYTEYFVGTAQIANLQPNPTGINHPSKVLEQAIIDKKNYVVEDVHDGAIYSDIAVVPMSNLKDVKITGWEFVGDKESYFETLDGIFGGEEDDYVNQDMIAGTLSMIEMNINYMLNIPIFKAYYDSKR